MLNARLHTHYFQFEEHHYAFLILPNLQNVNEKNKKQTKTKKQMNHHHVQSLRVSKQKEVEGPLVQIAPHNMGSTARSSEPKNRTIIIFIQFKKLALKDECSDF